MKDLLAKEKFIDAFLDRDARLQMKQSQPQSLWAALTLAVELESYQREFLVYGMNFTDVGPSTEESDGREHQPDDILA